MPIKLLLELPDPPALPAIGLPADLLLNRPDIRAAQARVAAADERIGAAVGATANSLIMDSLCDAAEKYYDWKCGPATPLEAAA